jgi:transposase-like protein
VSDKTTQQEEDRYEQELPDHAGTRTQGPRDAEEAGTEAGSGKELAGRGQGAPALVLPESVQLSLADLAGTVKEGLLAFAVATGLEVMYTMMDADVEALCGPKGRHDPGRAAYRHGNDDGEVNLGGRRVAVRRPRVRSADKKHELPVPTYEELSSAELLGAMALEKMMAKISTRRYRAGLEPVGSEVEVASGSTSKSSVSRRFVKATEERLGKLMGAKLSGLDLVVLMVDGVHFGDHLCVVAPGVDADGLEHPLGVVEGSTENATVVKDLLVDLRDRGLDVTKPTLAVIDGAKALSTAVHEIFDHPVVQRCQIHKVRNVKLHLPQGLADTVASKVRAAYRNTSALAAEAKLEALAKELERTHPGAAGSLREGLAETLTVTRLGVHPSLARCLRSTNSIESMIEICRDHSANVKNWSSGDMALRWCAAGMVEAREQFRRVDGYKHLAALRCALEAEVAASRHDEGARAEAGAAPAAAQQAA